MNYVTVGKAGAAIGLAAVLVWGSSQVVSGRQDADLARRIAALEAGQKEILKQLQEVKAAIQQQTRTPQPAQAVAAPPALPTAPVAVAGAASRGSAAAKLVMLEFSDFQCPYCGRYTRDTLSQLERDYVDPGKIRYVFRNFPLERIHPNAFKAAEAGECARQQGKFWEMHARLFANQQALADNDLLAHATAIGLDAGKFQSCVTSASVTARIRQDLDDGARAGITGTPTMFLGTLQKDGQLHVVRKIVGAAPYAQVKSTIDAVLALPEVSK